jgi:methionyl-tRNA formyltransferase
MSRRVVFLGGRGTYSAIVFNALKRDYPGLTVLRDAPFPASAPPGGGFPSRTSSPSRARWPSMAVVLPLLRRCSRRRIAEIMASAGLDDDPITGATDLDSVNSDGAREHLRRLNPELVVVSGTRLLSTSGSIPAPFLSIHMGISPGFRGAHGAYWALTNGRPDLAGTTIQLIDAGIDTGPVLKQGTFENHGAAFVRDISLSPPGDWNSPAPRGGARGAGGNPSVRRVACDLPSTLYYQPTVCQYARRRIFGGVR